MKTKKFDLNGKRLVCRLLSVHDADTVWVAACPYEGDCHRINLRLIGYDSAEIRTKDLKEKALAMKARKYFLRLIAPDLFSEEKSWENESDIIKVLSENMVLIHCILQDADKYGRTLATVFRDAADKESLNDIMIASGTVDGYGGGKKTKSWVVSPQS